MVTRSFPAEGCSRFEALLVNYSDEPRYILGITNDSKINTAEIFGAGILKNVKGNIFHCKLFTFLNYVSNIGTLVSKR